MGDSAVILEKMEFPEPVIKIAVEPKTKGDKQKMSEALVRLAAEDPSFRFSRDDDSGQTIIEGMGELHLEIIVDRMMREFNVGCNVGAPQVSYREAITQSAEIDYYIKSSREAPASSPASNCSSSQRTPLRLISSLPSRSRVVLCPRSTSQACRRALSPCCRQDLLRVSLCSV